MNKGGMCSTPFGNRCRLDRLDLSELTSSTSTPESLMYLTIIQDATHNYLFWGLGHNGTTVQEFATSCEYFFHVRSYAPKTWHCSTYVRKSGAGLDGKRALTIEPLSEAQIKDMCFDNHYEYSGLAEYLEIDRFLTWLKQERKEILLENRKQVEAYLRLLQGKNRDQAVQEQMETCFDLAISLRTMTDPRTPDEVADLFRHPSPTSATIPAAAAPAKGKTPCEDDTNRGTHRVSGRGHRYSPTVLAGHPG